MTIVSVASDLHCEFADLELPGGDILLVCGDTLVASHLKDDSFSLDRKHRYERFCRDELSKYGRVLVIGGNHEHYRGVIEETPALFRLLFSEFSDNSSFLDNEWEEIEGVRFIGSTLWAPSGYGTPNHLTIQDGMNDFSLIRTTHPSIAFKPDEPTATFSFDGPSDTRRFMVADAHRLHQDAVAFLKEAVQTDLPCVIMTHHAPTFLAKNSARYPNQDMDDAYFSNLHPFIEANPGIKMFFSGHTHNRFRTQIGETKLAGNPRGYHRHEAMSADFDPRECDFDLSTFEFVDAK